MQHKEARARIKINRLLEEAGWRFFDSEKGKANILLENSVRIEPGVLESLGEDFEKTERGQMDYLLVDERSFPLLVLEAKAESIDPLSAKRQSRKYAKANNCRFVILSNGNLSYFWDLERGNPEQIIRFPKPGSIIGYKDSKPDTSKLVNESIESDYVARTQLPTYASDPSYQNEATRDDFLRQSKLRFLRYYQVDAIKAIQKAVSEDSERFLFEMATGTGKTLTAAAVIKLFLRTGNANRVLFLVDRLELEDQAHKAFTEYLKNDYKTVIYKESKDDWRKAEIVVTTVQSLMRYNKYANLFSPTDFDFVISDEAHRSIGGNARAVFDYFIGYKLGLTATPRDYLRKFDSTDQSKDPREIERRMLFDTYRTFGCDSGEPTFRYTLLDGVKDKFLINPTVVDARTEITTQLLSDSGYAVLQTTEEGESESAFYHSDFEKKFFSEKTNVVFCTALLENALRDPITGEVGKTIVFAVRQHHASKIVQLLNIMADKIWPGKYNSDFAVQVTSHVKDSQQMTINFTNNHLSGTGNFESVYRTSKTRICVTVGMMTTGYDCPDILNVCLMRPIFSPTDFIQIKGRGTRKHNFSEQIIDKRLKEEYKDKEKQTFKLIDFFANCEYFEEKFNYDEVIKLPPVTTSGPGLPPPSGPVIDRSLETFDPDKIATLDVREIGLEGMKIDRMFFQKFEDVVKEDPVVVESVEDGNWDAAVERVISEILNKPEEYFSVEKLQKAASIDRPLDVREILERVFGHIGRFKSKDELLEDEFEKFISDAKPSDKDSVVALKYFFKAYVTDQRVRSILENQKLAELYAHPSFTMDDFKAVPEKWRKLIPQYIESYVPLNKFN